MNKFKFLKVFMVALVAFATLGCGDSNNDFIGTNPNNPDAVGGLLFQFHRGDASHQLAFNVNTELEGVVPANTDHLGFTFYSEIDSSGAYTGPWTGWSNTTFPFGAGADLSVSIANVPGTVHYAIVTAYSADGIPLGALYSPEFYVIDGYNDLPVPLSGSDLFQAYSVQELTAQNVAINITGTNGESLAGVTAPLVASATFGDGSTQASADVPAALLTVNGVDNDVATFDSATGNFTGVAAGTYDFTVSYGGVTSAAATLTVTDKTILTANFKGAVDSGDPPNGISWASMPLDVDETATLLFDVTYADGTSATGADAVGYDVVYAAGYRVTLFTGFDDPDYFSVSLTADAQGATVTGLEDGSDVVRLFAPGVDPSADGAKPVSALGVEVPGTV